MTSSGGTNNDGTVFSIPVSGGTPTTLFSFDGTHGDDPWGSLMLNGSTLYGMTYDGGATATARFSASPWAAALRRRYSRLTAPTVHIPGQFDAQRLNPLWDDCMVAARATTARFSASP